MTQRTFKVHEHHVTMFGGRLERERRDLFFGELISVREDDQVGPIQSRVVSRHRTHSFLGDAGLVHSATEG